jgi:16S rRNA (guanine966-N2)-methyltransferase
VFIDPPYGQALGEMAVGSGTSGGWLALGALVVWEESGPPAVPPGLKLLDQRRWGGTVVTFAEVPGA